MDPVPMWAPLVHDDTDDLPTAAVDGLRDWWVTSSHRLPVERRNVWVVAMALEEYEERVDS